VKAVLRIHLILMRIRIPILDPHWKKMDPDPNADPDQNLGQNTDLNPGDFLKFTEIFYHSRISRIFKFVVWFFFCLF